jgi:hypothetical protein
MMRTHQAIIVAGVLVAASTGAAIIWINRYQVGQPFNPVMFTRYDRWTGRLEACSSYYDGKTYCGSDLARHTQEAIDAERLAANKVFRDFGYSQKEMDRWPKHILEQAQNIVRNGGSKDALDEFMKRDMKTQ